jgi:pimeloyl-ACP methyl ester carboxylesterase
MPDINRRRLRHPCRGRRAGARARADAVELARHQPAYVGRASRAVHAPLPAGALRPPRPRPIGRAEGPLFDGAARPRRARDPRRARHREDQLVRIVDGRHGRPMARRQCAATASTSSSSPTPPATSRQERLGRPHQARARKRIGRNRRRQHGALVHQGVPRAFAANDGPHDDMFLATNIDGYVGCGEAIRDMDHRPLLAKINAPTLVIAGRHDPATTLEAGEFIAQHMPNARLAVLEPPTSPIWSSRKSTPTRCWNFCWRTRLCHADSELQ